jgi:hypothetical protein
MAASHTPQHPDWPPRWTNYKQDARHPVHIRLAPAVLSSASIAVRHCSFSPTGLLPLDEAMNKSSRDWDILPPLPEEGAAPC